MSRPSQAVSDQKLATFSQWRARIRDEIAGPDTLAAFAYRFKPGPVTYWRAYRSANPEKPYAMGPYRPDGAGTVRDCWAWFHTRDRLMAAYERRRELFAGHRLITYLGDWRRTDQP